MSRTFVVGDMHGAFKALQQLMERINVQASDRFIFLGDYVDGWSQSSEIIQWAIAFGEQQECIFLKGNHDEDCRHWLQTGAVSQSWLAHGGGATIDSYAAVPGNEKEQHLHFFETLRYYYVDDHNRLFIHAGFSNRRGPQHERYPDNVTWDRSLLETALALDKSMAKTSPFYPKRLLLFNEIYIGHTPTTGYGTNLPLQAANLWNMDTGAAFAGKLSAIEINSKQIYQSDTVMNFYPDEKGRNELV